MSPGTSVIVNLLGGVALLLWGVRMVRTGVIRAWGDRLKLFVGSHLRNRFSAFLAGAIATAILSSGTAMALLVAGIASSGAITTALGLAILLGADVGSAVVSSVFASGSSLALWASPILIFGGYVVFSMSEELRPHNAGRILIGLGLTLLSLHLIRVATAPLSEASLFHDVLSAIGREPLVAFVVGAILAWAFHSTLAAILLIASFLANGSLEVAGALSFIIGVNCGGGLPAVSGTLALAPAARRLPLANLLCRSAAAMLALASIEPLGLVVSKVPLPPVETAVVFHTLFNLAVALLFLPITGAVERLVSRLIPDKRLDADRLGAPRYLDPIAFSMPPVALSNAAVETIRMSEVLGQMLDTALTAMHTGSLQAVKLAKELDDRLNTFHGMVQSYLSELTKAELSPEEARRALDITMYVSNLEHAGDVICLSLCDRITVKARENITFAADEQAALDRLCRLIHETLGLATAVLTSSDLQGAKRLLAQKESFHSIENALLEEHFRTAGRGSGRLQRRSALYVDMIRELHRINSLVVSAGYPVINAAGRLGEPHASQEETTSA